MKTKEKFKNGYHFPQKLKELRLKNNLSQAQLADLLEIGIETIIAYENKITNPQFTHLIILTYLFKISLEDLLGVELGKVLNGLQ